MTEHLVVPESGWQFASAWLNAMEGESGSSPCPVKARPSSSPSQPLNPSPSSHVNLLLAEDNYPDALIVGEAIRSENLPVDLHLVQDGQAAIEFIAHAETDPNAPCPHLLLLDLNLPKRDGFEVLKRVRASTRCAGVPVLVITSSNSPKDLSRAAEFGAAYFRKPPSYDEFMKLGGVLRQLLKDNRLIEPD